MSSASALSSGWDDAVRSDLALLAPGGAAAGHLEDFVELVLRLLVGTNLQPGKEAEWERLATRAARGLGVGEGEVRAAVLALAKVLSEAAVARMSQSQFHAASAGLGLDEHDQTVLEESLVEHREALRAAGTAGPEGAVVAGGLPWLRELRWRLDLEVGSRFSPRDVAPRAEYVLRVELSDGAQLSMLASYADLSRAHDELAKALAQAKSVHSQRVMRYLR